MEKFYWLGRKRASLKAAKTAVSAEARLIHYDLAGRYSLNAMSAETRALYAEQGKLDEEIYRLSVKRGDKNPYKSNVLSNAAKARANADPNAPADPETEKLLREARSAAPAQSGRELELLLREARAAAR